MKKFNVEVCELGTITYNVETYNVEVEAENEDDARDNFWDLDDYKNNEITINTITEITDYHEDNGITCQ